MIIRSVAIAILLVLLKSVAGFAQQTVIPMPVQPAGIVMLKDRHLPALRRLARDGGSERLANAVRELLDDLNLAKFSPACCDYKKHYFLVVFTAPDVTGTTKILPILVHFPTPDSTELPGIHGEGDKQLYELFISEPDDSAALQATYTVAHEESPAEKQLGDFASTVIGKLALPIALKPRAAKRAATAPPPPSEPIMVQLSQVRLPETGPITAKYVVKYLDTSRHLKSLSAAVGTDQSARLRVRYAGADPGPACIDLTDLLKKSFDNSLADAACGAWIGDTAACAKKIGVDLATRAGQYFGAAPKCPPAVGMDIAQAFVDASTDVKTVSASSSIANSALVRVGFGLGFGYIASIHLAPAQPRAQIQSGNIATNPFTRTLTMAVVNLTPWGYDSQTHRPSFAERARFFAGPALTPYYGVAGGFAFEINRYLAVNGGYARLWFDTPKSGETIGKAPTEANKGDPFELASTGAWFLGLSYNLK